ncbi:hypothetical protein VTP01DRAFT_10742 [Rhizomucor pusillus]|uniref:uncharacterized protein n=1 Tax=Rhizomucor pusillus TaxID=4840 RepID=UPI00374438EB
MLQRNRHAEHGRVENIQHSQPVGILNPDIATKLPEKGKLFLDLLLIIVIAWFPNFVVKPGLGLFELF